MISVLLFCFPFYPPSSCRSSDGKATQIRIWRGFGEGFRFLAAQGSSPAMRLNHIASDRFVTKSSETSVPRVCLEDPSQAKKIARHGRGPIALHIHTFQIALDQQSVRSDWGRTLRFKREQIF